MKGKDKQQHFQFYVSSYQHWYYLYRQAFMSTNLLFGDINCSN